MPGSLREIDITVPRVPAIWRSPAARRDAVAVVHAETAELREGTDKPVYRMTESLATSKGVTLPRFGHAIDVYRQNMNAERTLRSGPLFVDTYA